MAEDCVFCKIVRGENQASRIYEDEDVMAFLDARPVNEGHTLVISRRHYENVFQISDEELANVFKIVKKVATAVMKSEKAEGIRILQNNGKAANQVIFHFHVHIIPEYEGQDRYRPRETSERDELEKVAARIREVVGLQAPSSSRSKRLAHLIK
jgi:diadenosine tetraphosphate (Ap4A) HIT family hydrolase